MSMCLCLLIIMITSLAGCRTCCVNLSLCVSGVVVWEKKNWRFFLPVKVNVCYLSAGDCYAIMILTIGGKKQVDSCQLQIGKTCPKVLAMHHYAAGVTDGRLQARGP